VISAAALCPPPPLLARELTGADPVLPELRQACLDAVTALLGSAPGLIAVVGVAEQTRGWDPGADLGLSAYAPALGGPGPSAPAPGAGEAGAGEAGAGEAGREGSHGAAGRGGGHAGTSLPLPLGLGSRLLDQAGYAGRRELYSIGEREQAAACAALGARIAAAGERVALLVMADGSARRGVKAPGYLDRRSIPFDAEVEKAVRAGDMAALLTLDAGLAEQLMATGRPAWQVLAGAMTGQRPASQVRYCDDPFGVAYLVASLTVTPRQP
jgi:hypothetical protein